MKKFIVLLLMVLGTVTVFAQSKKKSAVVTLGKVESYAIPHPSLRHIVVSTEASDKSTITFARNTDSISTRFIATALQVRKMNTLCDHAGNNQVLVMYAAREGNTTLYRLIDFRIAPFNAYHSSDYSY